MRRHSALFLAPAAFLLGGCSTMIHGPFQDVQIDSSPQGAMATVSPTVSERGPLFLDPKKEYKVTTPATLRLRRDNSYRVEFSKPGYKITSTKVVSAYDWLWAPALCGPCEAIGQLPNVETKEKPLPVRFLSAAFYEYPKGFFRAFGRGVRIFNPEALLGHAFKLRPEAAGTFSGWHGLGTPSVSATLEPTT
jgi:hypothetical protein